MKSSIGINRVFWLWTLVGTILLGSLGCGVFGSQPQVPPTTSPLPSSTPRLVSTRTPFPTLPPSPTPIRRTSTPTATPFFLTNPVKPNSNLFAFIYAPPGPMDHPFVVLSAYSADPALTITEISGRINKYIFTCSASTCAIPVDTASPISFRAFANNGDFSPQISAVIRFVQTDKGYYVSVEELSPLSVFRDSCADIWGKTEYLHKPWSVMPQSPNELNTSKDLHYLAAELIRSGVVDASACPAGGLTESGPNGCGMALVEAAMLTSQNQYDFSIWLAGRNQGIPPRLLRALIEQETQFWPKSSRSFEDEFGLSQLSQQGADVLLRWDRDFYKKMCNDVLLECDKNYFRQPYDLRAMLRGAATNLFDADCKNCSSGVDVGRAQSSVQLIARVLQANCSDVKFGLDTQVLDTGYEDYWKFTLVAYHSGIDCLMAAVRAAPSSGREISWDQVAPELKCPGAREYVDSVWNIMDDFENHLLQPTVVAGTVLVPTEMATETPVPSPTLPISSALVWVQVYVDANGNGQMDAGEGLNDVTVHLNMNDGTQMIAKTVVGYASFDMAGYPVNMGVTVVLPELYRSYSFRLPPAGDVKIPFAFTEPPLPGLLP